MKSFSKLSFWGFVLWILFIGIHFPFDFFQLDYVAILLLAAPLFLIQLASFVLDFSLLKRRLLFLSAILKGLSFTLEKGEVAALLSLPWLLSVVWFALESFLQFLRGKNFQIENMCKVAAFLYLPIGAAWAFSYRLGFQPMGFDENIVLLTAVHFHYAGFLLPVVASFVLRKAPILIKRLTGIGIIFGIPLVAIGITASQFDLPNVIEFFSVVVMAGSAFVLGVLIMVNSLKNKDDSKYLWFLSGLCLVTGMTLAFLYGIRFYVPLSFLSIPWMYAVHGTCNAFGFALPGLIALNLEQN